MSIEVVAKINTHGQYLAHHKIESQYLNLLHNTLKIINYRAYDFVIVMYLVQWHKGQRSKQYYTDGRILYFLWINRVLTLNRFVLVKNVNYKS